MDEHKSYLRYLDHCRHFLGYHFFFATSAETERNNKTDSMGQNFPCIDCHSFPLYALDKPNGILTMTLKSQGVHSQEMPGTEVPLEWVAIF